MRVVLVDMTGQAGEIRLSAIADALAMQAGDYAFMWQAQAVAVRAAKDPSEVQPDESPLYLLQDADQAGALGYHDTDTSGRPLAKVFVGPVLANGGTWTDDANSVSVTCSHEFLEAIGDPYANWWADSAKGFQRAIELCDFVESQGYASPNGIYVSNFVGPRYFSLASAGPYDFMGAVSILDGDPGPGNYEIRRMPGGDAYPVFGDAYPEWKKPIKALPGSRVSRRLKLEELCGIQGVTSSVDRDALRTLARYHMRHKYRKDDLA